MSSIPAASPPRFPVSEMTSFPALRCDSLLLVLLLMFAAVALPVNASTTYTVGTQTEMNWSSWIVLLTILAVVGVLLLELAPVTSTMFAGSLFLMLATIIDSSDFIVGLNSTSVLSIALLFIVVEPLSRLPLMKTLVQLTLRGGSAATPERSSQFVPVLKLCLLTMVLSAFANQNPIVVLLTPIVKQYCRDSGNAPSLFLMPMAFASALGGSWTLVGTSVSLTYDALMLEYKMKRMSFFELFQTTGVPSLVALIYVVVMQKYLLPKDTGGLFRLMREKHNSFIAQFVVAEQSPLVGRCVDDIKMLMPTSLAKGSTVIEIVRHGGQVVLAPPRGFDSFCAGDLIVFTGPAAGLQSCAKLLQLEWVPNTGTEPAAQTVAAPDGSSWRESIAGSAAELPFRPSSWRSQQGGAAPMTPKVRSQSPEMLEARLANYGATSSFNEETAKQPGPGAEQDKEPSSPPRATYQMPRASIITDLVNTSFRSSTARDAAAGRSEQPEFIELVLSFLSHGIGSTVGSGVFQRHYGVSILALRKGKGAEDFTSDAKMDDQVLHQGDTLLVFGPASFTDRHEHEFSLISFATEADGEKALVDHYVQVPRWFCAGFEIQASANPASPPPQKPEEKIDVVHSTERSQSATNTTLDPTKRIVIRVVRIPQWYPYISVALFLAMIAATASGIDIFRTSAVTVCLMVFLKLLTLKQALQAIDLHVILGIAFSFGLGAAMTKSGLADVIANAILNAHFSGFQLMLLISAVGSIITNAITNKACAQVMFPIVFSIYTKAGKDPMPAVMVLCAVSSWAFCTPYGKPTNLIIMGPGGYRPIDYARFGFALNVLVVVLIPISACLVYGVDF